MTNSAILRTTLLRYGHRHIKTKNISRPSYILLILYSYYTPIDTIYINGYEAEACRVCDASLTVNCNQFSNQMLRSQKVFQHCWLCWLMVSQAMLQCDSTIRFVEISRLNSSLFLAGFPSPADVVMILQWHTGDKILRDEKQIGRVINSDAPWGKELL